MGNSHWTDRLSDYLDGELDASEKVAADRHLAECSACAAVLADLTSIASSAASLPDLSPGHDLWPGIVRRLRPRKRERQGSRSADRDLVGALLRRRVALTVPQLAAAAVTLSLLSAAGAWAILGAPDPAWDHVALESPSDVVLAAYEPAMAGLEAEYDARRGELDPETIVVVERNLAIMDAAIREARDALESDPSSGFLNAHLAEAVRRRMNLLREVASI
jgi:hypothetical protein